MSPVAGIYRREQWPVPLGAALLDLVECSRRLKLKHASLLNAVLVIIAWSFSEAGDLAHARV